MNCRGNFLRVPHTFNKFCCWYYKCSYTILLESHPDLMGEVLIKPPYKMLSLIFESLKVLNMRVYFLDVLNCLESHWKCVGSKDNFLCSGLGPFCCHKGDGEWSAKVFGVSNLHRAFAGTVGPRKGGESVGGAGCLGDGSSNS